MLVTINDVQITLKGLKYPGDIPDLFLPLDRMVTEQQHCYGRETKQS